MKSLNRVGMQPVSLPLSADDIVEFHAARLMLLMHVCGVRGQIDGLTKMAKLDFFARYPDFFEAAKAFLDNVPSDASSDAKQAARRDERVESAMVRHHYGPWDKRYYHILAHLEAKRIITVSKENKSYKIALTPMGVERAKSLAARPSFKPIVERMKVIKKTFGSRNGSFLKGLIYRLFDKEVGERPMGERISR